METPLNNSPFYIGQEVVALIDDFCELNQFKKGDVFPVLDIKIVCCDLWGVYLGFISNGQGGCPKCYLPVNKDGRRFIDAKFFAPVTRLRISSELTIASDLLKDAEPEVIDYEPEKVEV